MDRKIPKVALAGASGNVGEAVLKHMLEAQFEVTVLARKGGKAGTGTVQFPAGVTVKTVDFSSTDELAGALKGHDAVVDTTRASEETMMRLMDAAAAAGVYRFIPSSFSLDSENTKANELPVFAGRAAREAYLARKCAESGMTWTVVCNGPFLDWNLRTGFMQIDLYGRTARLMDGGNNVVPWTKLDDIGRAVTEVLLKPAETENRPVYISSIAKSPAEMVALARDALAPPKEDWRVTCCNGETEFLAAVEAVKAGKMEPSVFGTMVLYANSRSDMAHPWPKPDNELLEVKQLSDDELMQLIKDCVKQGPLKMW